MEVVGVFVLSCQPHIQYKMCWHCSCSWWGEEILAEKVHGISRYTNELSCTWMVCLFRKIPVEKESSVFGIWEAEDECFIQNLCDWFGINLWKASWLGLPLSVFVSSYNSHQERIPPSVCRIRYSCPLSHTTLGWWVLYKVKQLSTEL